MMGPIITAMRNNVLLNIEYKSNNNGHVGSYGYKLGAIT